MRWTVIWAKWICNKVAGDLLVSDNGTSSAVTAIITALRTIRLEKAE